MNEQQFDLHMEALERIRCGIIDVETAVQNIKVELPSASANINCATPCDVSGMLVRWCLDNNFTCPNPDQVKQFVARLNAASGTSHN